MAAKRIGKNMREKSCSKAVDVGRTDPNRNKSEHVWAAIDDGCPTALKKRPTAPEHDRCGENELEPIKRAGRKISLKRRAGNHVGHSKNKNWRGEDDTNPESPR